MHRLLVARHNETQSETAWKRRIGDWATVVTSKSCICSNGGQDHKLVSSIRVASVSEE